MTPEERVALQFVDRINAQDVDGLANLMTADHVFVDALGQSVQGRDALLRAWRTYLRLMPDYRIEVERLFVRDGAVAVFGSAAGTYAPGGRIEPRNHWQLPSAWLAIVRDDLIAHWRVYADNKPVYDIVARTGA